MTRWNDRARLSTGPRVDQSPAFARRFPAERNSTNRSKDETTVPVPQATPAQVPPHISGSNNLAETAKLPEPSVRRGKKTSWHLHAANLPKTTTQAIRRKPVDGSPSKKRSAPSRTRLGDLRDTFRKKMSQRSRGMVARYGERATQRRLVA